MNVATVATHVRLQTTFVQIQKVIAKKKIEQTQKPAYINTNFLTFISCNSCLTLYMIYSRIYHTIWCNISNAKPYYQGVLTATRAPSQENVSMERVEQSQGLYQSETHGVNAKKKDTKKQIMEIASV